MCDDYVARVNLISHMLNHALNSNSLVKEEDSAQVEEVRPDSPKKPLPEETAEELPPKNKTVPEKQNVPPKINEIPVKTSTPKIRAQNYCSECDKTYVDKPKPQLNSFQNTKFTNVSDFRFADSGGYKYHINSFHKKIKKYECDICGNHFSCKRVITNHLRGVHMKERIFECNQCAKRFSTDSALYMHKKIHDNIFKCVCTVCDRRFRSASKLKIHMTMLVLRSIT